MTTRRRTVVLSVQDDFSRQLKEYARQMDAAGDATTELAKAGGRGGTMAGVAFNLNQIFGAAQKVYGIFSQIVSTANEWQQIGVGAERSKMALDAMAGSAQEAERWITAITDATRDTVTEGEAAAQAYQLMRFGLADSAEAAGKFVHDMSIIAAINPQLGDTAEAINQIQLTLSNQSFMRLDQLGISAGQVRKRIKELREETASLGQEEAFQIAVMEELNEQTRMVGDGVLELTSNQDKLRAQWKELKEDIGIQLVPAFEGLALAAGTVLTIFEQLAMGDWSFEFIVQGSAEGLGVDLAGAVMQESIFWADYFGLPGANAQAAQQSFAPQNQSVWAPGMNQMGTGPGLSGAWGGSATGPQWLNIDPALAWEEMMGMPSAPTGGAGGGAESGILPTIQQLGEMAFGGVGGVVALEKALDAVAEAAANASDDFESLNEKFQIDPDSFDVDVLGHVQTALGGVEIEAELAAEAIQAYELATGIATAQSVLFDSSMSDLAQSLADNEISIEEFVLAVQNLSNADMSGIDAIFQNIADTSGLDKAIEYLDRVAEWGRYEGGATQEEANPWLAGLGLTPGDGGDAPETGPFQGLLTSAGLTVGEIKRAFATGGGEWDTEVTNFVDLSGQNFYRMKEDAITQIRIIKEEMGGIFELPDAPDSAGASGRMGGFQPLDDYADTSKQSFPELEEARTLAYEIEASLTDLPRIANEAGSGVEEGAYVMTEALSLPAGEIEAMELSLLRMSGDLYSVNMEVHITDANGNPISPGDWAAGVGLDATGSSGAQTPGDPGSGTGAGGGDWQPPQFAVGGYTGDSSGAFGATLHGREYVVPERGALVVRGGNSGANSAPIVVQLQLDRRTIYEAVVDVDQQRTGTKSD